MTSAPSPKSALTQRLKIADAIRFVRRCHVQIGLVEHPDPIRRATARALSYVLAAIITICFLMALVAPVVRLSMDNFIASLVFGVATAFMWRSNRQGSLIPPIVLSCAMAVVFPTVFNPDTYISVEGHPVVHLLFIVPVLLLTFFVHPASGLLMIPVQIAALVIPERNNYPSGALTTFVVVGGLNMMVVYAIGASLSLFLRSSLRDMARLNATLEQRVAERTADLSARNVELAAARDDLTARNVELAATREALARTMRQAAHDINNLLTLRLDDGDRLARAVRKNKLDDVLYICRSITANVRVIAGLVSDLRESGVAVSGQLTLASLPVNMEQLSQQVGGELDFALQEAGITYTVEASDAIALGDAKRLLRVMLNIVGNAIKFIGSGHEIRVRMYRRDQWIVWECQDDGIGIHPDKLAEMGKEFARLVHGDGAPGGTGIGLHFCGIIARLSSGDIQYYSAGEDCGTTVTLLLPVCED